MNSWLLGRWVYSTRLQTHTQKNKLRYVLQSEGWAKLRLSKEDIKRKV